MINTGQLSSCPLNNHKSFPFLLFMFGPGTQKMDTRGKRNYNSEKMEEDEGMTMLEDYEEEEEEDQEDDQDDMKIKRSSLTRKRSSGGGMAPPYCQVEVCTADMTHSKPYHRRHKVCEFHAKAPIVFVAGLHQRFCQQCSRFHVISEFDDTKRSCRRRLAGHNERRRKSTSEYHGEGSN